jgi:uncharacterized membrane protein
MASKPDIRGSEKVTIAAPRRLCEAILLDVERYPQWYDTLDAVEVLERDTAGRASLVHLVVAAGPLGDVEFDLRMSYSQGVDGRQVSGDGRVVGVHSAWRLERHGARETEAVYRFQASAGSRRVRLALRAARPLVERGLVRDFPVALKREAERCAGGRQG